MERRRTLIMGAAGRDFHDFNVFFRDDPSYDVVAFTAAQIPDIEGRRYPPLLAGESYPDGIPILAEQELERIIDEQGVDLVVFAYSDVSHEDVMHKASRAIAAGASFLLLGPDDTMLKANKPVISVGAARTGVGKSPVSRFVARHFRDRGYKVGVLRHPMPYGDLERQAVQRFATLDELDDADCTIEEREEYEPHIRAGATVFSGVDYERIVRLASQESDILVWDGGNNDFPFVQPDLHIVLVDPHRPGHELRYHPGEANLRMADLVIVSKVSSARPEDVAQVKANAAWANPRARVMEGDLDVVVPRGIDLRDKRVIVVEDGPTTTHGGLSSGAGLLAARRLHARVIDPRPWAVGSIARAYEDFPHLAQVVPALGYSAQQVRELRETLDSAPCDYVIDATPADLQRVTRTQKRVIDVRYEYADVGGALAAELLRFEDGILK